MAVGTLIFVILCAAGVVFLVWFLTGLCTDRPSLPQDEALNDIREAVHDFESRAQELGRQLGATALVRQIVPCPEWKQSDAHCLHSIASSVEWDWRNNTPSDKTWPDQHRADFLFPWNFSNAFMRTYELGSPEPVNAENARLISGVTHSQGA